MIQSGRRDGRGRSGLFRLITSQNDSYCIELGSLVLVSNEVSAPLLNSPPRILGANFTSIKPYGEIVGSAAQRLLHTPPSDRTSYCFGYNGQGASGNQTSGIFACQYLEVGL